MDQGPVSIMFSSSSTEKLQDSPENGAKVDENGAVQDEAPEFRASRDCRWLRLRD